MTDLLTQWAEHDKRRTPGPYWKEVTHTDPVDTSLRTCAVTCYNGQHEFAEFLSEPNADWIVFMDAHSTVLRERLERAEKVVSLVGSLAEKSRGWRQRGALPEQWAEMMDQVDWALAAARPPAQDGGEA